MKKETEQITDSIYVGMSVFNILKNTIVKIDDGIVSLEDKKYLSLYLGIINSENKISKEYKKVFEELQVNYKRLNINSYIELYRTYFIDILKLIDFSSIDNYFDFLLEVDIIQKINKNIGFYDEKDSNKKLIKQ